MDYGTILRIGFLVSMGVVGIAAMKRLLTRVLEHWCSDPVRTSIMVRVLTYFAIFLIGTSVLQELGINITALLGAAGILGVAISFAAQSSMSNMISGVFIFIERPFSVDDEIQIDEYTGKVVDINLFSIALLTPDHRTIRIPHEKLLKNIIVNKTYRTKRRYEATIALAYHEDFAHVQDIFVRTMRNEPYCLTTPSPLIWIDVINGDMMQITVALWVESVRFVEAKQHLLTALYNVCKQEKIQLYQPSTMAIQVTQK